MGATGCWAFLCSSALLAACAFRCLFSAWLLMTFSDSWNSIFRSPLPAESLAFRACVSLKFILGFLEPSSSFGIVGSRFSALMRFISETTPARRVCLKSRVRPLASASANGSWLSISLVWGSCDTRAEPPGAACAFAAGSAAPPFWTGPPLLTELNCPSSSSSASSAPSISDLMLPLSISRAMRSARSRCSFGTAVGSSFVV
mmetsp:Transcript_48904/g.138176  ORF Transcript_48904/g.138176 Transcript_48904/m.138176 type:complete len:202 (+) Transcript_48904:1211-1816(+)